MAKRVLIVILAALLLGLGLYASAPVPGGHQEKVARVETVLSPQPDTIWYDDGNPMNIDINQNALFAVRFTPVQRFTLMSIYFMLRNAYNTTDGCSLWVAQDNGGIPAWPATYVGYVSPPLPNETWVQLDLAGPMYFEDDFYVGIRQLGGPYPGPGFWVALDYLTTTYRTLKSYDNGQGWLDESTGDALIRAGGWYGGVPAGDYGDAPDGADCLYPWPVMGRFPTYWDAATRGTTMLPGRTGAHHLTVTEEWLGPLDIGGVPAGPPSVEVDADDPWDPDVVPNDLDTDGFDNCLGPGSLLIVLISIPPPAYLTVQVTIPSGAPAGTRYANVLFDLTMDGQWGGTGANGEAEWAVQNEAINVTPGNTEWVTVGPFPYANGLILPLPTWARITLTRNPIGLSDWDGSAPPGGFEFGETEDWYIENPFLPKGRRKPIVTMNCPARVLVPPGGNIFFNCMLQNRGGPIPAGSAQNPPAPGNAANFARVSFDVIQGNIDIQGWNIPGAPIVGAPNNTPPNNMWWGDWHLGANGREIAVFVTPSFLFVGNPTLPATAVYTISPQDPGEIEFYPAEIETIAYTIPTGAFEDLIPDMAIFDEDDFRMHLDLAVYLPERAFQDTMPQTAVFEETDLCMRLAVEVDTIFLWVGGSTEIVGFFEDFDTGLRPLGYPITFESSDTTVVKVSPTIVDVDQEGFAITTVTALADGSVSITAFVEGTDYPSDVVFVTSTTSVCGLPCDDNQDGVINILDVIDAVNIILGIIEPDSCQYWRADCNGDGVVNILDPLANINCILEIGPCPPSAGLGKAKAGPARIYTPEIEVPARGKGETGFKLPIHLDTEGDVRGLQLKLSYDPGALSPGEPQLAERCAGMTLASNAKGGELTIVVYSPEWKAILAGSGSILTVPFTAKSPAEAELQFEEIILAGYGCQEIPVKICPIRLKTGRLLPETWSLEQNYPNPFNPCTDIRYQIPAIGSRLSTLVSLKIYNILGQEVRTLVDELKEPGYYTVTWDGKDCFGNYAASGIYFYQLSVGSGKWSETKRMVLLK